MKLKTISNNYIIFLNLIIIMRTVKLTNMQVLKFTFGFGKSQDNKVRSATNFTFNHPYNQNRVNPQ